MCTAFTSETAPPMDYLSPDPPGFIYIVQMEGHPLYKIGRSVDIPRRMSEFGILLPFPYKLLMAHRVPRARHGEHILHREFRKLRTHGEWFHLTDDDLGIAKTWLLYMQSSWLCDRVVAKLHNNALIERNNGFPYLFRYSRILYRLNQRDERRCELLSVVLHDNVRPLGQSDTVLDAEVVI